MSGGYFEYSQYRIEDIASAITNIVRDNNDMRLNSWGGTTGRNYPPEIIARFNEAIKTLRRAAVMAQRVDWLVSDDDGEDAFMRRWDEELKELEQ